MSARNEARRAVNDWRQPIVEKPITDMQILFARHGQNPALVRLLTLSVKSAMYRARLQAQTEPNAPAARNLARHASNLEATAKLLELLA